MHNCKETKEEITELLLDGVEQAPDEALSVELRRCAECRAEFDALKATLRITSRFSETAAAPPESYWIGYHERLRKKLTQRESRAEARTFLLRSISVPVPLGIAVLAVCITLGFFAIRGARREVVRPLNTTVVRVPVEVPVVQEKIVTRVVYRERRSKSSPQIFTRARADSTFAKSEKSQKEDVPASLTGFKPTDEIKLTVIKGGSSNEK